MDDAPIMYMQDTHAHLPRVVPDVFLRKINPLVLLLLEVVLEIATICKLHNYVEELILDLSLGEKEIGFHRERILLLLGEHLVGGHLVVGVDEERGGARGLALEVSSNEVAAVLNYVGVVQVF